MVPFKFTSCGGGGRHVGPEAVQVGREVCVEEVTGKSDYREINRIRVSLSRCP